MESNSDLTVNDGDNGPEKTIQSCTIEIHQVVNQKIVTREIRVNGKLEYKDRIWFDWWNHTERPGTIVDQFIQQFNPWIGPESSSLNSRQKSSNVRGDSGYLFSLLRKGWFNLINFKKKVFN